MVAPSQKLGSKAGRKKSAKAVPVPRKKKPLTDKQKAALASGRCKPGEIRNPKGAPKKVNSITIQARELVEGDITVKGDTITWPKKPPKATGAYWIAKAWVRDAIGGDKAARDELLNRMEGRTAEVVEVSDSRADTPKEALDRFKRNQDEIRRILGE